VRDGAGAPATDRATAGGAAGEADGRGGDERGTGRVAPPGAEDDSGGGMPPIAPAPGLGPIVGPAIGGAACIGGSFIVMPGWGPGFGPGPPIGIPCIGGPPIGGACIG
jgi:hypothetical protein